MKIFNIKVIVSENVPENTILFFPKKYITEPEFDENGKLKLDPKECGKIKNIGEEK